MLVLLSGQLLADGSPQRQQLEALITKQQGLPIQYLYVGGQHPEDLGIHWDFGAFYSGPPSIAKVRESRE